MMPRMAPPAFDVLDLEAEVAGAAIDDHDLPCPASRLRTQRSRSSCRPRRHRIGRFR